MKKEIFPAALKQHQVEQLRLEGTLSSFLFVLLDNYDPATRWKINAHGRTFIRAAAGLGRNRHPKLEVVPGFAERPATDGCGFGGARGLHAVLLCIAAGKGAAGKKPEQRVKHSGKERDHDVSRSHLSHQLLGQSFDANKSVVDPYIHQESDSSVFGRRSAVIDFGGNSVQQPPVKTNVLSH